MLNYHVESVLVWIIYVFCINISFYVLRKFIILSDFKKCPYCYKLLSLLRRSFSFIIYTITGTYVCWFWILLAGFGSMLRALGVQIEKTTDREACRDLSGRRVRDINNEKKYNEFFMLNCKKFMSCCNFCLVVMSCCNFCEFYWLWVVYLIAGLP